jgi:hypothetical protein
LRATPFGWWRGFRSRRSAAATALAISAVALPPQSVRAQSPPTANTGRIEGVVTDTLGMPLRDVTVLVASLRRSARTRDDGTFLFVDLPPGRLRLTTRAIGLIAAGVEVDVPRSGVARAEIRMLRLAASLPVLRTSVTRPGLGGVVGDTTYRALEGVQVRALGRAAQTLTDSVGEFHLPLRPGSYMLRLDHAGHATQTFGVHLPDDSGKRVSILMTPAAPLDATEIMRQRNLFDLEQRLVRARPVRYKTYSRETLERFGSPDLMQTMARATSQRVDPEACAAIDGGPAWAPLWSISIDEVEFVEANLNAATSIGGGRGPTSINGMRARSASPTGMEIEGSAGLCPFAVWLRR